MKKKNKKPIPDTVTIILKGETFTMDRQKYLDIEAERYARAWGLTPAAIGFTRDI